MKKEQKKLLRWNKNHFFMTKRITRSKNNSWNKNTNISKIGKTDISSALSKRHFQKCLLERTDKISVLPVLDLLVFLFQTMFSFLVILFVIKLYAGNNTFDFFLWLLKDFEFPEIDSDLKIQLQFQGSESKFCFCFSCKVDLLI